MDILQFCVWQTNRNGLKKRSPSVRSGFQYFLFLTKATEIRLFIFKTR